jgi:YD repeat-containing protein
MSPLLQTTEMDARNVVPDSNLDGIVKTSLDMETFGNDSGVMGFEVGRDAPQVDVPLYVNTYGQLPVHGYLAQGAFAASSSDTNTSPLLSTAFAGPNVSAAGTPYAFSLNERADTILLIDDGVNHVKHVQVTRPGGNAVVFDFPWNAADNEFGDLGVPLDGGPNGQRDDSARTYVLRDLSQESEAGYLNYATGIAPVPRQAGYALEFADGTIHLLGGNGYSTSNGALSEVTDTSGLQVGVFTSGTTNLVGLKDPSTISEPKYDVAVHWANGQIHSIDYATRATAGNTSTGTITLTPSYVSGTPAAGSDNGQMYALLKSDPTNPTQPAAINQFSYTYDGINTITENQVASLTDGQTSYGIQWQRSGSIAPGATITITQSLGTVAGSFSTAYALNAAELVTTQTVTRSDPVAGSNAQTDVTAYVYVANYLSGINADGKRKSDAQRYTGNDLPKWGQVNLVTHPDGSTETYTYYNPNISPTDPANKDGWLYQSTLASGGGQTGANGGTEVETYGYSRALVGGGAVIDPQPLVARPTETVEKLNGTIVDTLFDQYSGLTTTDERESFALTGATWDNSRNVSITTLGSAGTASVITPDGRVDVGVYGNADGTETILTTTYDHGLSLRQASTGTVTLNAFGYTIQSVSTDMTTTPATTTTLLDSTGTLSLDSFGRPLKVVQPIGWSTPAYGGNPASNTAYSTTSTYQPYTWFGPTEYDGADGSVTTYSYTPFGQIDTKTVNGVATHYTYNNAGQLIQTLQSPGNDASGNPMPDRVTEYLYDWAGRVIATKAGVKLNGNTPNPTAEDTATNRPISYTQYNWLGQAIATYTYDGDKVALSDFANWSSSTDANALRAKTQTQYDALGQATLTLTAALALDNSGVETVDGSGNPIVTGNLQTTVVYDQFGQVIYSKAPGGLVTRTKYDGFGNVLATYSTDGNGGAPTANADDSSNLTKLASDHVLNEVDTQYDSNDNVIFTTNKDRSSNAGTATGALTDSDAVISYVGTDYDNFNGVIDTVNFGTGQNDDTGDALVSSESYVPNTDLVDTTKDALGTATHYAYDSMGQTTDEYDNWQAGSTTPTTNQNVHTHYDYNSSRQLLDTIKYNVAPTANPTYPNGVPEETSNSYGGTGTPGTQYLNTTTYSDSTTNNPDTEVYTYDSAGDVLTCKQRDGTVHTYAYNALGEKVSDTVTTFGTNVDVSVTALTYTYNTLGQVVLASSMNGSTVVNQVMNVYNGLGQLLTQYQEHNGAVNTGSYKVQYIYDQSGNFSRLQRLVYPNGRVVWYNYNSGVDNLISRISSISDGSTTAPTLTLESYTYLGLNDVVDRNLAQPGITEATALNSFGEVQSVTWTQTGVTPSLDQFSYTYNADGSVLTRDDGNYSADNETYGDDPLNRQTIFDVAGSTYPSLNPSGNPLPSTTSWTLDSDGNRYTGPYGDSYNATDESDQNQYSTAGYATTVLLKQYAGYAITAAIKYDAWGRVVVTAVGDILATDNTTETYDALGRRITQTASGSTRQSYYDGSNVIEERAADGTVAAQYVWSGPGQLLLRDQPQVTSGPTRLYALSDAAGSITSIVGYTAGSWQVMERYLYTADGQPIAVQQNWTPNHVTLSDGTSEPATSTMYGWNFLYHGLRFHTLTTDVAAADYQPIGLYEQMGGTQWTDPQHGRTLTPNEASDADAEMPYDPGQVTLSGAQYYIAGVAQTVGTVASGAAAIMAFPVLAPFAIVAGVGYLGWQGYQGYNQYGGAGGALAKASGISAISENWTNQNWQTGAPLGLSDYDRGAGFTGGLFQFGGFVLGAAGLADGAWTSGIGRGGGPQPLLAGITGESWSGLVAEGSPNSSSGWAGLGFGMYAPSNSQMARQNLIDEMDYWEEGDDPFYQQHKSKIEELRTRTSEEVDVLRAKFNNGIRGRFIRQYSNAPEAAEFFTSEQLEIMRNKGELPADWIIHHKVPLFRGGTNDFSNLDVLTAEEHQTDYAKYHLYPEGQNPYGMN